MRLPPANSAARAALLAQVIMCLVVGVAAFWVLPPEDSSASTESDFVPVEGVVVNLETHQGSGRSNVVSMTFSIRGHNQRFFSSAVNGVHPSWREGDMIVRTYVPANRKYWNELNYGALQTYGLWINGVEQLSLRNAIHAQVRSEAFGGLMFVGLLAVSIWLGYTAFRTVARQEN